MNDALSVWCKKCYKKYESAYRSNVPKEKQKTKQDYFNHYYQNNKTRLNAKSKKYYEENKTKLQKNNKIYRKENHAILTSKNVEYYKINKEKILKRSTEYVIKNQRRKDTEIAYPKKKKCIQCGKVKVKNKFSKCRGNKDGLNIRCKLCSASNSHHHYLKNQDKYIHYRKTHKEERNLKRNNRKKIDLDYRILEGLRSRLHKALKNQNCVKNTRTMHLIGCNIDNLKRHIEKQFIENMSWDNYGYYGWHIDHIRPCVSFDLTKPTEQKKCFNYKNLQPMWGVNNMAKGSKYNGKIIRKISKA